MYNRIHIKKRPNILVIGDLMIDHYLWGSCERISPEAPVPVVNIQNETTVLGGAGNVVNNLVSLDSNVTVLSVIGKDEIADELKQMLKSINVNYFLIEERERKTSKKSRIIASHSQIVRYDKESKNAISEESEKTIIQKYKELVKNFDIILLSDYGKGVLTDFVCHELISIANALNKKVLVDPKGIDYTKYKGAYFLTPNKKEAELATKIKITDNNSLVQALKSLKTISNLRISLITLSEDGIVFLENKRIIKKPTVAREVFDVTGAGDTVLASLGFALSLNMDLEEAVEFANLAAGVVVGKIGSSTVTLDEIEDYKASMHQGNIENRIKDFNGIKKIVDRLKDKKIVFTNGCFDILHRGHISYLNTAKSFGDILILGLNSDESVRKLKGKDRPINTEYDRAFILSALEAVDYVVIFNEETPYELIKIIQPDVLVKGGDYQGKEVVGSDIAKELQLVTFIDGKSTTNTIKKIKGNKLC